MTRNLNKINQSKNKCKKWGETVGSYFQAADITNEIVNFPAIVRGLGDVKGKIILDYGCGNGRFSKKIEEMGAKKVIGVDRESSMIDLARKANTSSHIEYRANPDNTLSFLPNSSVDKVMANLVFMMSPTKKDMQKAFGEIYRIIKKGGTFVYLITHPAFIERGAPDYRNEFDGPFNYFAEGKPYKFILNDLQGKEIKEDFYDYHYTLATYFNMTIRSGFIVTKVEELAYDNTTVVNKYKIAKEFQKSPQSLMVVLEK